MKLVKVVSLVFCIFASLPLQAEQLEYGAWFRFGNLPTANQGTTWQKVTFSILDTVLKKQRAGPDSPVYAVNGISEVWGRIGKPLVAAELSAEYVSLKQGNEIGLWDFSYEDQRIVYKFDLDGTGFHWTLTQKGENLIFLKDGEPALESIEVLGQKRPGIFESILKYKHPANCKTTAASLSK